MSTSDAVKEFKNGFSALREGYQRRALAHFKKALELDSRNPFYLSYLGLALAMVEGQWAEAEELCLKALRMRRCQPELYLNLAEVYRRAGKKEDAVWTLEQGALFTKRDLRVAQAMDKLGVRQPPVFSFLDRKNPLNRGLGKLRHKVFPK